MKKPILFCVALATLISCTNVHKSVASPSVQLTSGVPDKLLGEWTLQIENLQRQVITTMTIHFSKEQANSCLAGTWNQVVVDSYHTADEQFFPVNHSLSYELSEGKLVIGRNDVCDAYLHLTGELIEEGASGEYIAFGWGHRHLGYFSLKRNGK